MEIEEKECFGLEESVGTGWPQKHGSHKFTPGKVVNNNYKKKWDL